MYTVPQASLTLPAVVGRRLSEGLGITAALDLNYLSKLTRRTNCAFAECLPARDMRTSRLV
jgi:hypothetical protein